jgi:hypothetical protein
MIEAPGGARVTIALTSTGEWLALLEHECRVLGPTSPAWLLVVEMPLTAVRAALDLATEKLQARVNLCMVFPYDTVVLCALDAGTEHYVDAALAWLEGDRLLITPQIRQEFESIALGRKYT